MNHMVEINFFIIFQPFPGNTNKFPMTVNMAGQWATRIALACISSTCQKTLHKDFAHLVARQIKAVHYNARWLESESLFMWDIKISDGILPGAYEYSTPYGEPLMVDFA